MSDIAILGIKINSSDVEKSTKSLEKMVLAAERAEAATKKMEAQMAVFSSTTKNVITEETKRQKSIDNLIKSLTMQEIKLSSGKAALVDYKLSLLGATEAEKKQAAAISANIKKMEDSAIAIRKAERASTGLELVSRTLTSVLTTLGATFGVRKIIDYADMWTMVQGRMSLVTKNTSELIAVQGRLFELAQETRMSFESTADLYTRVARSTESVTKTQNDLLSATENINKAMIISGSSVESANAAIIQLGQGFASGTLQGEELRSVLEQTPRLARAIADGMGVAVGELRKMGKEGKLTSEEVFKAILSQGAILEQEFGKMPKTVKQGLTLVDNAIMKFIGQMNDSYGVTKTLAGGLTILSENIEDLAKAGFVLLGAAIPATITAIASAMKALTVIMTRNPIGLIAVGISSAVAAMIAYKDSVLDIGTSTATALEWAKSTWNETGGIIVDWGSKIYTSITESFKGLGNSAGSIAAFIGTTYEENFSKIMTAAKKTINIIVGGFIGTGVSIGNTAAFIYESFENAFNGIVNIAIAAGKDIKKALSGDVDFSNTIRTASENAKKSIAGFNKYIDESASIFKTVFQTDYVGAFGDAVAHVGDNISKGAKDLHATTMANAKEKTDAEKAAAKALEYEMKATKTAIEFSKEAKKEKESSKKLEEDRLKNIADIIKKLQEERDTLDMTKEQLIAYKLALLGATPAQIAFAQAIQKEISAAEERKRVTADFKSLQEKLNPELKRQNDLMADFKVVNDAYAMGLIKTKEEADKLKESLEFNSFSGAIDELKDKLKFEGTNFGNEMADGINNAVISMQKLNIQLDKQAKNQKDIDKLQKEIDTTSNLDLRAKKQKKMDELTEDSIKSQMSGYRQLFGTASQLFKENSREREVMHNIEMAFAAAEIAMNLEKTISAAYLAIAESGTLPPPASFAAIAAMTALMAGIVAAAGGSLSGGGSASAPSVSVSSTQGTGTVMGNPSEKSQSANNALEFMKDIEAKQYNELRDINKGVVDLNNNITNLVTSIVRTGAGTGDMGIKTGTSTSTSELQNISSKGFLAAANLMSLGTISASQAIASLTKNIPVLGNITSGVSDWINDTVSSFSSAVFGGTKKTSILAQGLEVSTAKIGDLLEGAGLDIQKFADIKIKKSGGLFGSDKTYLKTITENLTPDEESIKIMFTNVFKNVGETMVAISKELNMGDDKLKEIYSHVFDIGKIDLKGMDTEQINEAISSVINTASDQAVTALFGELIGKYVQVGEALLETAIRVVSERAVVLDILEMTGQGFKDSDIPAYSLEITQSLINIAGGIKELQEASVNYYDKFFSDEEKQIRLHGQLTDTMTSLGTTLPTSRKELRNFVEGLDLTSIAGQEAYVTILGLTDGFDKFFTVIEDGQAITDANNQAIKKNISDIQIASAQMDMTPFEKSIDDINRSTNAAIETNKALGASESDLAIIREYGDKQLAVATKAEEKRKEAEEAATQATKDATEARIKSLTDNKMVELLEAEGKSAEALALKRSIELAGMEKSLIPMQEKIYKLQDEKAAYEITSKAIQERIDKEKEVAEAIKAATDAAFQKEGAGLQEAQIENMRAQGKMSLALATERAVESREMGKMVLALKQSTWAIQDKLKIDNKMIEILNLEGKTTEALYLTRQIELSGMEESLRGYQLRIYALQDEKTKQEEIAKTTEYFNAISAKTIEILTLEGKTTEATNLSRQLEINKMDASLKPLQERIWILEDAKKAEEESVKAIEATIQKENAKNSLLVTLLELEGSTADATRIKRMLEINAMDEALRPMQERIYALQDQAIEEEKIQSIADKRNELNIRQLRAMGKEEQALAFERTLELNSLDATLRAKQINIWMLEDEKEAQEKATQALEESNNKRKTLLEEQVSSAEEMLKKSIDKQISFYQTVADEANKILEDAKNLLDRSFASEQESITKKHEALIVGLTSRLEEAQTAASDLETVFNSLSDARKSMEGDSGGLTYNAVQKQLIDAISMAKGGDISGAKGLVPNLGILTSQGTEKYGSNEDYKRDFFKTYNALSELESLTGTQLTDQQQIIKALETQIEESNINNQAALDALQNQYDAVIGVDKSVISFQDAIAQYQKAQYEADGANALLKTQTEILNNQLNTLLGIDSGILSVSAAINALAAAQAALKSFSQPSIPSFANGGTHYGGLRLVGKNGPEMEYTPPSNITSNNDIKSIMSNEEVIAELKAMRAEHARANFELVKNSDDSKKTLREWKEIGIITRSA